MDSKEVVVHSVITTAAGVADAHMLSELPHGAEMKVCHPTDQDLSAGDPGVGRRGLSGTDRGAGYDRPQD